MSAQHTARCPGSALSWSCLISSQGEGSHSCMSCWSRAGPGLSFIPHLIFGIRRWARSKYCSCSFMIIINHPFSRWLQQNLFLHSVFVSGQENTAVELFWKCSLFKAQVSVKVSIPSYLICRWRTGLTLWRWPHKNMRNSKHFEVGLSYFWNSTFHGPTRDV